MCKTCKFMVKHRNEISLLLNFVETVEKGFSFLKRESILPTLALTLPHECPADALEVLQILKDAGVTKISIGIQSFCDKYQKTLGKKKVDTTSMKLALACR